MPDSSLTAEPSSQEAAAVLAGLLSASPRPVTLLLAELCRKPLRIEVLSSGERDLTAAEHFRLDAGPLTQCRYRTGLLRTGSLVAAETYLLWLPSRLPAAARDALEAAREPAGAILGPFGMHRSSRRALTVHGVHDCAGGDIAVRSSAVLMLDKTPAGIASEEITMWFCHAVKGRVSPGRAQSHC